MNRYATLISIWCLSLALSPAVQTGKTNTGSAVLAEKLCEIVDVLRIAWREDFESNYKKYMLGPSPMVLLISREEMRKIAAQPLDGRRRDAETTQGLTIGDKPNVKIVVVYEGLAPLLVAKTIVHEIGHLELRDKGMSRNLEEAQVRKVVETGFFEKVLGSRRLEMTAAALQKKVLPVEKGGRVYQGHTTEAVEMLYRQLRKAGINIGRNPLHDQILATVVFILTNNQESLAAALNFEDDRN
jgi:hypothetical protein